ncbi:MAG: metallophosphoesterase family protein [Clostridia bacterium]|nr:metallophosphoesterase family protein [Clostridia bacterium]MBP3650976.1 metallophosphoesterase family protein [Clostridia bacterium]
MPRYRYRRRRHRINLVKMLKWLLTLLVLAVVVAVAFASTQMITVQEHDLRIAGLPDTLKNLRIVYLSDIHQGPWFSQKQVNQLITQVNGLSADIVIFGGDYAQDAASAAAFFRSMPDVSARLGVYAVAGDKDRSDEDGTLALLLSEMKNRGVTGLVNSVASIKLGKNYIYVAGADDYAKGYPKVNQVAAQVKEDDFVIFAGHSPNLLPAMHDARDKEGNSHWYDLALFGHTHGGQINLFGYTPFRKLRTEMGSHYRSGWLEENRAHILVSNGVGTEFVPLRLFAAPQVHLIVLKKGS